MWDIIERYAVTLFLTTGAALRILSRMGDELVRSHNMDTLRALLVTAEPLEVNVWEWAYKVIGTGYTPVITSNPEALTGRIPVVNLYIQSEIGTFVTGNLINYTFPPLKPGSSGPAIPGFHLDVVDGEGRSLRDSIGELVLKSPWPALPIEAPEDFYIKWVNGVYRTGDYALMTPDGYVYALGRRDGIMKVSGYRLSPGALRKAVKTVEGVVDVEIITCPDDIRFEAPIVLVKGVVEVDKVRKAIREIIGPIAEPREVVFQDPYRYSTNPYFPNNFDRACSFQVLIGILLTILCLFIFSPYKHHHRRSHMEAKNIPGRRWSNK